jgi:hypothetical protein
MNTYDYTWDLWSDELESADAWIYAEDSDLAFPNLPAPRRVQPMTVRRRIRAAGGHRLTVGEIVPSHQAERGLGQLVRRKEEGFRTGHKALVTYDPRGNVYMRVYTAAMNPTTSGWQHIGAVTISGLPADPQDRGRAIEARIRQLVGRATGIVFHPKSGRAQGPDLVPQSSQRAPRSRRGVGVRRFDEFLALD